MRPAPGARWAKRPPCGWQLVAVCCALCLGTATPGWSDDLSADAQQNLRRLLAAAKAPRATLERQVGFYREAAALGPAAVERIVEAWTRDLEMMEQAAEQIGGESPQQAEIDRHRATINALRADPDLTREKLEHQGEAAVDALARLWNQVARERMAADRVRTRWLTQGERLQAVLEALQADEEAAAQGLGPTTLEPLAMRLTEALQALGPTEEERYAEEVLTHNAQIARQFEPEEVSGMATLNEMRMLIGLRPLRIDPKLVQASRMHSNDMRQHGFFDHESPVEGRTMPADRARLAGTSYSGENIHRGSRTGANAIRRWFLSPGHFKNMLGEHTNQGLGRSGEFWTHMFNK